MPASKQDRNDALKFIVALGVVSLFADMTYEGAYSIIGPYWKEIGASAFQVGLISGIGEMMAASLRYFSGRFADRTRAYWAITIAGYCVNVVVVPALAFAGNFPMAAMLVIAERTGKSLRGPARDVLLSEATGKIGHGWGFGVHAAMDQTGAVLGPVLMYLAVAKKQHFAPAFLWLVFPAVAALTALLIARAIYPNAGNAAPRAARSQNLPGVFWWYAAAAGLLACGFVDFPLLSYHFEAIKVFDSADIPLLYAAGMGINGLTAMIFGKLFDRYGISVLSFGILISLLALPLGFLGGPACAAASVACWASGLGVQDASLRAGIARVVSMNKRGTAFGAFNGIYGIAWCLGSIVMGALLYGNLLVALVIFGVVMQAAAAVVFFKLRQPLAEIAEAA